MARKLPRVSPPESRMDSLIAESKLRRAQLTDEWEAALLAWGVHKRAPREGAEAYWSLPLRRLRGKINRGTHEG